MDLEKDPKSAPPADTEADVTSSAATSTANDESVTDSSPKESQGETMAEVIARAANGDKSDDESDGDGDSDEPEAKTEEDSEEESDEEAEGKAKETDKETQTEEEEDEGDDVAEGQKIPYKRFKNVIDQRNGLKEELQQTTRQVETFKKGHDNYQAIESFMWTNEIPTEDVVGALEVLALMNSDPAEAARRLQPTMQRLQQFTGELLPADVQEQVDTGEISETAARELVASRNQNRHQQYWQGKRQESEQQRSRQERVTAVRNEMAQAANTEQKVISQNDPDYKQKAPLVRDRLQVLIQQHQPNSAEAAKKLVRQAYSDVSKAMGKARPDIKPGPSSNETGKTNPQRKAEPETMAEAIARAAAM